MNDFYQNWRNCVAQDEQRWQKWIASEGKIFLEIGFPPTALLDKRHFDAYVGSGSDLYDYEQFELSSLTNEDALKVLVAAEQYITEPFESWLIRELREKFHLPFEYGEPIPPIPQNLIDEIINAQL